MERPLFVYFNVMGTTEKPCYFLNGINGCRKPYALHWMPNQLIKAFEADSEVRAAFCTCDRMNLVDDHRLHARQYAVRLGGEQQE